MNRCALTVPYKFKCAGKTETRFRRICAIFENARGSPGIASGWPSSSYQKATMFGSPIAGKLSDIELICDS